MIEQELKYMLKKKDYMQLISYLKKNCKKYNVNNLKNIYIDTSSLEILNKGISLRLRNINNEQWIFTYKCKISGKLYNQRKKGLLVNEEVEEEISGKIVKKIVNNKKISEKDINYFTQLKKELDDEDILDNLEVIGKMDVLRTKCILKPYNIPIELDKIDFDSEETEYELESETKNIELAESVISSIFRRLDIKPNPSKYPKIIRLIKKKSIGKKLFKNWEV